MIPRITCANSSSGTVFAHQSGTLLLVPSALYLLQLSWEQRTWWGGCTWRALTSICCFAARLDTLIGRPTYCTTSCNQSRAQSVHSFLWKDISYLRHFVTSLVPHAADGHFPTASDYSELHAISLHQIYSNFKLSLQRPGRCPKPAVDIWMYLLFASFVSGFLPSQWSTLCIHWVWRTSSSSARQKSIALAVITFWPLSQMAANLTQLVCLNLSSEISPGHTLMHISAMSKEDALRWKEETSRYCSVL